MINKVILLGRLGKEPETRVSESGFHFCNFSFATSEKRKGKDGSYEDRTEWHNVVTLGKTAEACSKYLKKGSQAYIEGKIQTRKWKDKEDRDRYTTEILADTVRFLDKKSESSNEPAAAQALPSAVDTQAHTSNFDDDDIPF